MTFKALYFFPALAMPEGVAEDLRASLQTASSADALAIQLAAQATAARSQQERAKANGRARSARKVAGYLKLHEQALRVEQVIKQDLVIASETVEQCLAALERLLGKQAAALDRKSAAETQAARLQTQLAELAVPHANKRASLVASAQAAFDRAMVSGDEAAQNLAAAALAKAEAEPAEPKDEKRRPLEIRLRAYEELALREQDAVAAEDEGIANAREDLGQAMFEQACIELDDATNRSMCAQLKAENALRRCTQKKYLAGAQSLSFWFSNARRALRQNNILSTGGDAESPVVITGFPFGEIVRDSALPDLSAFVD